MLTDRFVEIKAAKLLRDNGFDEITFKYYNRDEKLCNGVQFNRSPIQWSAPTQTMALDWIRRTYGVHIMVDITENEELKCQRFFYVFKNISNGKESFDHETKYFKTPEECIEDAINVFMGRIDSLRISKM